MKKLTTGNYGCCVDVNEREMKTKMTMKVTMTTRSAAAHNYIIASCCLQFTVVILRLSFERSCCSPTVDTRLEKLKANISFAKVSP